MSRWDHQLQEHNSLLEQIIQKMRKGEGEFRFNRPFITASDIAGQYFCEKKVEMKSALGDIETESKAIGTEAHENLLEDTIRIKREDLWKKIHRRKLVIPHEMLLLTKYKNVILAGRPDCILFFHGLPIFLFEYKFTKSRIPFRDHHVQARTYGILLRNMGFDTSRLFYAIVMVEPDAMHDPKLKEKVIKMTIENGRKKAVLTIEGAQIFLTKFNESEAEQDLDWAIGFWKKERMAIPTGNPKKCRRCEYNTQCNTDTAQNTQLMA